MFGLSKSVDYPVLPLRDIVVFPHMIVPLFVGREKSISSLQHAMGTESKQILLLTQQDGTQDEVSPNNLYDVGTLATILQFLSLPDGTAKVLVEGVKRVKVSQVFSEWAYLTAFGEECQETEETEEDKEEISVLVRSCLTAFEEYIKINRKIPPEVLVSVNQSDDPNKVADTIASHLNVTVENKQEILSAAGLIERLELILSHLTSEISLMQTEKRIRNRVKHQMEKSQRDYYLNEQLKAIQKELGEQEDGRNDLTELEDRLRETKFSKEAREKVTAELRKLKNMNQMSAEATVVRNYLDWMISIPWQKRSRIKRDIQNAKELLDTDHYGLDKVKERILEYLAVQSRVGKIRGQILCLMGPPGVGKTSLGKSIAEATGRSFVRISLGGVRDEAEIRGHRRTYIGSMPGKIIQGMKKAKTSNPLFLLDEIDKLGADWRGDPSSALLEVLDPEQNSTFNDHYLEVDYDLSDVMFVTTANTLKMPQPLLDRMEVIRIPGYTEDEKMQIAIRHLIPRQMKLHGLKASEFILEDGALRSLIRLYTREAGVRNLEREIANLSRKAIKDIITGAEKSVTITDDNLKKYAGIPRFHFGVMEEEHAIGATTGLAWTEVGGELLTIEALILPGKGSTMTTGKLGEVMQESIKAAVSYIRSKAASMGIDPASFEKRDIHVHVPEGAIPKDGPSAGVAMCTSIVSALTGIAVRKDVAMTGEVTLRGRVLPIGGLKEKLLAAHRGGITKVLIPADNEKDLEDIPDNIKGGIEIVPVKTVEEVLAHALIEPLVAVDFSHALAASTLNHNGDSPAL